MPVGNQAWMDMSKANSERKFHDSYCTSEHDKRTMSTMTQTTLQSVFCILISYRLNISYDNYQQFYTLDVRYNLKNSVGTSYIFYRHMIE